MMRFSRRRCLLLALQLLGAVGVVHIAVVAQDASTTASTCSNSRTLWSENVVDPPPTPPLVSARILQNGVVKKPQDAGITALTDVWGCCSLKQATSSKNTEEQLQLLSPQVIGTMPQFSEKQALEVLESAKQAWHGGSGTWPQMSLKKRLHAIQHFVQELSRVRDEIINVLMWEIGKNVKDATSEFDRTIQFIQQVLEFVMSTTQSSSDDKNNEYNSSWQSIGTTRAFVRRAAIGIILCLGPFNYPLNETYATLIPALLMGNVVIMKIPTVGGLAHLLTMEAFAKALPPGTIQFISGSGRSTMPPLMSTGSIDGLAFIGGSSAADDLIQQHPHPHRLKVFLQLEAKNMGIFLPDLFEQQTGRQQLLLDSALDEAVLGSLSYNGQRCTALKLLFVPAAGDAAERFAKGFAERVEALTVGLPWQRWGGVCNDDAVKKEANIADDYYSQITPLPNQKRVDYMKRLIDDATSKGAKIINANGGSIVGGPDSTLMIPAVLYPVTPDMDVYHEEQFGPIVPIAPYDDIETVLSYGRDGEYGQQCSIFTSGLGPTTTATTIVDQFSSVFGKININSQCGRSPDTLPFSGRRSSAMGVMSVTDALREFSVPTVISYKDKGSNSDIVAEIQKSSKFMEDL